MRVRTPQLRIRDLATRAKTAWLNCVLPIQRTVRVGPGLGAAQSGGVPTVLFGLAGIVDGRRRSSLAEHRRQDVATLARSQKQAGAIALGQRVGQRAGL